LLAVKAVTKEYGLSREFFRREEVADRAKRKRGGAATMRGGLFGIRGELLA
jgi:hypothetical protein